MDNEEITPYEPEQLQQVADQAIPRGAASEHVWPNLVVLKLLATLKALVAGMSEADKKLIAIRQIGHGTNGCSCEGEAGECSICSILDCEYHDAMHYHHDGCPSEYVREAENDARRDAQGQY